ncbi:MAG TPA: DUF4124 domain-containing protein [Pseudomonadales bacterium]|nr:DUF4124 domain-containing protein [Pseudomonadales bacterium]
MRIISMAAMTLVFVAVTAQADVYQWKDAQGRVHFGDQAPQNNKDVKVLEKSPEDNPDAAPGALQTPPMTNRNNNRASKDRDRRLAAELEQERRQKAEERKRKLGDKEKLEKECTTMKNEIAQRAHVNLYVQHNKNGGIRYMTDPERAKEDEALKQQYQQKCEKIIKQEERKKQSKVGDDF